MTAPAVNSIYNELEQLGRVYPGAPLSMYTTFKTGGPAELLFEAAGDDELCRAVSVIRESGVQFTVIGGGSNLLVSDRGLSGVVIRMADDSAEPVFAGDLLYAAAPVSKEFFIGFALDHGLGGVEFMAGIPGAMGGGIYMNAGTYMGSFSDILESVKVLLHDGTVVKIPMDRNSSRYRKMDLPENSIILGGFFKLPRAEDTGALRKRIDEIISDRHTKHPMEYPSAGSVFKNPEGYSSWKLIDDAGLKGFSIGGAKVSEKHTNFIINAGGAVSSDIYRLVKHVQERVYGKSGVMLETEIRLLGEFD